jgi:hypothetical protein
LGNEGYCEKFSFMAKADYVCDDYRPSGVIKESGMLEDAAQVPTAKAEAVKRTAQALSHMRIEQAMNEAQKDLLPSRYGKTIDGLKMVYEKTSSVAEYRRPFMSGLDPLGGNVATEAIKDRLDANVSSGDMRRNKRMATLGGIVGGGVVVPAAVAATIGAGRGAMLGKGTHRARLAAIAARAALKDTFQRAGAPALVAGGAIGGMGASGQYDLGAGMAELASSKSASVAERLQKIAALSPYLAYGGTGASLMGVKSLLGDKDKIIRDVQLRRKGKISPEELRSRMRDYGGGALINAGVGAGLGVGATWGAKKVLAPALRNTADDLSRYAGKKFQEASTDTLKSVDDLMTKQRSGSEDAARNLANQQRKLYGEEATRQGDDLLKKIQETDFLKGTDTRKASQEAAAGVRDDLSSAWQNRRTVKQRLGDWWRGTPPPRPPTMGA